LTAWAFFTQHYAIVPVCIFAFIAAMRVGQGTPVILGIHLGIFRTVIGPRARRWEFNPLVFAALLTMIFPKLVSAFPPGYVFTFFAHDGAAIGLVALMVPETKGVPLDGHGRPAGREPALSQLTRKPGKP